MDYIEVMGPSILIGEIILQRQKNWFFLFLLFMGLVGCTTYNRGAKFENRVRFYSQAIRWSEFERAQPFIRMREDHTQKQDLDFFNKIKVTKYQSTDKTPKQNFDEQSSDIILVYEIDYFIDDDYKLKHVRDEQLWWYDETEGDWFLDSGLPKFK
jgi:hypothetical protein